MLAAALINTSFPSVTLLDKVGFALQLMEDYDLVHLPVTSEEKYLGLIAKEDLLDADGQSNLMVLAEQLLPVRIKRDEFFLVALKLMAEFEVTLMPVINDQQELLGLITNKDLLQSLSLFLGNHDKGGLIVLATDKRHFSFGDINRLVETNDAYITQLNTYEEVGSGKMLIHIKINKEELADLVATFQRYDYDVRFYFGEEAYANELKENYHHLLSYLNM